jgi:hypothetical protein
MEAGPADLVKYTVRGMRLFRSGEPYTGYRVSKVILGADGRGALVETEHRRAGALDLAAKTWSEVAPVDRDDPLNNLLRIVKFHDNCGTAVALPRDAEPVPVTAQESAQMSRLLAL